MPSANVRALMQLGPEKVLSAIQDERSRRESEASLMGFTRHAWSIIEPGVAFRDNWHLHAIAEHLEAILSGQINNLVIAIPPGCMKSILVSVMFPAYAWIKRPDRRFLGASYGADLAIRDSAKCHDIITSEWYARHWGDVVAIKPGADQKMKYELTGGGWRMATSVGGRATGEHPDFKTVDDALNAAQAQSDVERQGALDWFDRTLSSRGQSRNAKTIVVAQRFHERDLSGHILAKKMGYEYLCIPMEYDGVRRTTKLGTYDPRTEKNELLWPELFPRESVDDLKVALGEFGTSGQLQQSPSPGEGGILKVDRLRKWPAGTRLPQFEFVLQSYDTAFSERTTADQSACTVWGVFTHGNRRYVMLVDAWAERLGYPALRKKVISDWSAEYGGSGAGPGQQTKPVRPSRVLVEKKASGQSLIQDLQAANVPVVGFDPGTSDKVARAHLVAPALECGLIWVLESSKTPGEPVAWAHEFVSQLRKFPVGDHDDYTDTCTQAIIYLMQTGWLALPRAADVEDRAPPMVAVQNPYVL